MKKRLDRRTREIFEYLDSFRPSVTTRRGPTPSAADLHRDVMKLWNLDDEAARVYMGAYVVHTLQKMGLL